MPPGAKTANGAGSWGGAAPLHLGCVGQRARGIGYLGAAMGGDPWGHPQLPPTPPGCPDPNAAVSARLLPAGVVAFRFCSPRGYPGRFRKEQRRFPRDMGAMRQNVLAGCWHSRRASSG